MVNEDRSFLSMSRRMRVAVAMLFGLFGAVSLSGAADSAPAGGWDSVVTAGGSAVFAVALAWKLVDWIVRRQGEQLERVEAALGLVVAQLQVLTNDVHHCPVRLKHELADAMKEKS